MKRRKFSASFKTKVVLEALKEQRTLAELSQKHNLHPQQISSWKQEFLKGAETVFRSGPKGQKTQVEERQDQLLKTIGELKVENDFFKGRLAVKPLPERKGMISKGHSKVSVARQCQILDIHRSSVYYKAKGILAMN
jgi:transposase